MNKLIIKVTCFLGVSNLLFTYLFFLLWIARILLNYCLPNTTAELRLEHLDEVLRFNLYLALRLSKYLAFFFAMIFPLSKICCCLFQLLPKMENILYGKEYFQKWRSRLAVITLRSSELFMMTLFLSYVASCLPYNLEDISPIILYIPLVILALSGIMAIIGLVGYLLARLIVWIFEHISIAKMEKKLYGKEYFKKWLSRLSVIILWSSGLLIATWLLSYAICLQPYELDEFIALILCVPLIVSISFSGITAIISLVAYLLIQLYVWVFGRLAMKPADNREVRYLNYTLYTLATAFLLYVYFYNYPSL